MRGPWEWNWPLKSDGGIRTMVNGLVHACLFGSGIAFLAAIAITLFG